jgi:hypothetical protein
LENEAFGCGDGSAYLIDKTASRKIKPFQVGEMKPFNESA